MRDRLASKVRFQSVRQLLLPTPSLPEAQAVWTEVTRAVQGVSPGLFSSSLSEGAAFPEESYLWELIC
jgi:hypothetical protein